MNVTIYSDGGVRGNGALDAIGAYGAILMVDGSEHKKEIKEAFKGVTNNQMELKGAIESLKLLKYPCNVKLYTDSSYVVNGITKWIQGWVRTNWISASKKPVKNKELWQELLALTQKHNVEFNWVRGHADNELNNRADELCNIAMDEFRG